MAAATRSPSSARRARATRRTRCSTASSCTSTGRTPRRQQARLRHRVRLLVPGHRLAGAQGAAGPGGSTSSRPATRPTSSGRSALALRAPGRHAVRLRPPRPVPGAVTSRASPSGREAALPGPAGPGARARYRTADHVISTNESYRDIAIKRSGKAPADVTVVRTGPDPERLRRGAADPALRRGRRYLAAYIGVMGPQDGVDIVVRAADVVVHELGRDDIAFTLMGSGDCFDELVALRDELGPGRPRRVHRPRAGRARRSGPVHRRRRAVARPQEPAERRVHDEQDDGVHGVRAAGGRLRPARDPGVGRRRRGLRDAERHRAEYAEAIVGLLDDEPQRAADGQDSAGPGSSRSWPGVTSSAAYLGVYDAAGRPGAASALDRNGA